MVVGRERAKGEVTVVQVQKIDMRKVRSEKGTSN